MCIPLFASLSLTHTNTVTADPSDSQALGELLPVDHQNVQEVLTAPVCLYAGSFCVHMLSVPVLAVNNV